MDVYHERRLVSWIARYCGQGKSLDWILTRALARKPPFVVDDVRRLYPLACQAAGNADLMQLHNMLYQLVRLHSDRPDMAELAKRAGSVRICDVPGCRFLTETRTVNRVK